MDATEHIAEPDAQGPAPPPFVALGVQGATGELVNGLPVDLWHVESSGDWEIDFACGWACGDEALRFSRNPGLREFPFNVLREIVAKGRLGDLENGFIYRIASAAFVGAHN